MYVSVIIKSKQHTDTNLNAEHRLLGPGFHKNLHECLVMQIMWI